MGQAKKFMYINRHAPCGTAYAVEGLEVVLIGAAFEPVSYTHLTLPTNREV